MTRPVFVKLGGSVLTDKAKEGTFKRAVARRLIGELVKADVPLVLFHGAGSFGHPAVQRWRLHEGPVGPDAQAGVSETLAAVARLEAEMLDLAYQAGLRPMAVPLHLLALSEEGVMVDLPIQRIEQIMAAGFTPVLHGTMVRDEAWGWRVVSADELMAELAPDLNPRLALFVTDVDGVYRGEPGVGEPLDEVADVADVLDAGGDGADVTGRMEGKVRHGLSLAHTCPVLVVNGTVRGRVLDALKGKPVPSTRLLG